MTPTSSCLNGNKKAAPGDAWGISPYDTHFNANRCNQAASQVSQRKIFFLMTDE